MIKLRAPTLVDFLYVAHRLPPDEAELYTEMSGLRFEADRVAAQLFLDACRCWAFVDKYDAPVALGGYTSAGDGVWKSWFMATGEAWHPHGIEVTDRVREIIVGMLADESVQRLETATLATRTRARAWYERIGLSYDSTACKASASGQDIVTYVAQKAA